ncbi:unnamed protein product [Rangifer tarandus platyrhynchus]|uniref:Uncharacterized protein n=2 Tax=Rangifer tarandus platyrhynchus TaxID=3082113 RepID=A0ABN8ZLJ3_RANTA|nr:unnamed protein product [Rangifer tarandus platyrhynchus]CAI9708329.1 unnamed protein product [Rangifer tarandus platyrhynchus]
MSDVPGPTTQRPSHGKGVRGREPEWEGGVGKKRGPGEGRRGSSGGGRSPGEEPLPGHRRPQERPPPTETLCLGDGQEPVQGGQVCGAVTSPGCAALPPGRSLHRPHLRPAPALPPPEAECPPVCGRGTGRVAGHVPLDAALQNSRLYKQPPGPERGRGSEAQYSDEPPGTWPVPLWEHFRSCGEDSPSEPGAGSQSRAGWGPLPGAGMEDAAQPGDLPVLQQGKPASGWRATMTDDQDEPLIHGTHTPTHPVLPVS